MAVIEFKENSGNLKINTPDGKSFIIGQQGNAHDEPEGDAQIDFDSIKRVGFENIFDLQSYSIEREGDLTVHNAGFNDGGHVRIVFTAQGKLVEFSGHGIGQSITEENEMMIRSDAAAGKI